MNDVGIGSETSLNVCAAGQDVDVAALLTRVVGKAKLSAESTPTVAKRQTITNEDVLRCIGSAARHELIKNQDSGEGQKLRTSFNSINGKYAIAYFPLLETELFSDLTFTDPKFSPITLLRSENIVSPLDL